MSGNKRTFAEISNEQDLPNKGRIRFFQVLIGIYFTIMTGRFALGCKSNKLDLGDSADCIHNTLLVMLLTDAKPTDGSHIESNNTQIVPSLGCSIVKDGKRTQLYTITYNSKNISIRYNKSTQFSHLLTPKVIRDAFVEAAEYVEFEL